LATASDPNRANPLTPVLPALLTAESREDRMRLDVFVASRLYPEFTRSQVARMIKAHLVMLNGEPARASAGVRTGDRVEILAPRPAEAPDLTAPAPDIAVMYADDEIIVVNKPAGMTVHPAPGHPDATLVDALLARFPELARMAEPDGVLRPGIVHRLDKETSGVMVVARTPFAKASLSSQFKERTVKKIYLAMVRGTVSRDRLTISRPVGRHPVDRKRFSISSHAGREAVTHVIVLRRFAPAGPDGEPASMVAAIPETGRTHQIRVHLASIGHPCLADKLYGVASRRAREQGRGGFERHALHALALAFAHPRSLERIKFIAPLAQDFTRYLESAGASFDERAIERLAANLN
jgi:23S rRNA pseudouridine1911/1915/1917 synthase